MNATLLVVLLVGFPVAGFGYTDPGTGVFLLQSLIAGSLGIIYTFRKAISRIFFRHADEPVQKLAQGPPAHHYREELAYQPAGEAPLCERVHQKLAQGPPAHHHREELAYPPAGEAPLCERVHQKSDQSPEQQ